MSFNTVKKLDWLASYGAIRMLVEREYNRHDYLKTSDHLNEAERDYVMRVAAGEADDAEFSDSLMRPARFLRAHHD